METEIIVAVAQIATGIATLVVALFWQDNYYCKGDS